MKSFPRLTDAALVSLLLALVFGHNYLATGPFADVPRNDDFAYARSAQGLGVGGQVGIQDG